MKPLFIEYSHLKDYIITKKAPMNAVPFLNASCEGYHVKTFALWKFRNEERIFFYCFFNKNILEAD